MHRDEQVLTAFNYNAESAKTPKLVKLPLTVAQEWTKRIRFYLCCDK